MNVIPMLLLMIGFLMMAAPLFDRAIPSIETLVGVSRALRKTYHSAPLETPAADLIDLANHATERLREDDRDRARLKVVAK